MDRDLENFIFTALFLISIAVLFLSNSHRSEEADLTYLEDEIADNVVWQGQNPNLDISVHPDRATGHNIRINVQNFYFKPENVNKHYIEGEGHAHVYINGEKVDRVYNNYFYLYKLPSKGQEYNLTVSLHANDHRMYFYEGEPVMDSRLVLSPKE